MTIKYEKAYLFLSDGVESIMNDLHELGKTLVNEDKIAFEDIKKIYNKLFRYRRHANKLFLKDVSFMEFQYDKAYYKLRSDLSDVMKLLIKLAKTTEDEVMKENIMAEFIKLRKAGM